MKKVKLVAAACLLLFFTTGCLGNPLHNAIYDDDAKIAETANNYNALYSIGNTENNTYTLSAHMTGADTIWKWNTPAAQDIEIYYSLSVLEGGKAKIVLIAPDNTVTTIAENTGDDAQDALHTATIPVQPGLNRIKIVAYDKPKLELTLCSTQGKFGG